MATPITSASGGIDLPPDLQSELLNLNEINHKIVLSSNYYVAHSDTHFTQLPQLDRLNDDATDQALRDIKPHMDAVFTRNFVAESGPSTSELA